MCPGWNPALPLPSRTAMALTQQFACRKETEAVAYLLGKSASDFLFRSMNMLEKGVDKSANGS